MIRELLVIYFLSVAIALVLLVGLAVARENRDALAAAAFIAAALTGVWILLDPCTLSIPFRFLIAMLGAISGIWMTRSIVAVGSNRF